MKPKTLVEDFSEYLFLAHKTFRGWVLIEATSPWLGLAPINTYPTQEAYDEALNQRLQSKAARLYKEHGEIKVVKMIATLTNPKPQWEAA